MPNINRIEEDKIFIDQEISYTRERVDYECEELPKEITREDEFFHAHIQHLQDQLVYFRALQRAFRDAKK